MKLLRYLLAAAALLFAGPALAAPACSFNLATWYFIVGDVNPTTNVRNTATGAYVVNTDATFLAWLAGPNSCPVSGGAISAAANNAGAARLTVTSTANMQTGQRWQVYGTGTYDGTWPITVDDATHVTLQGSTFSSTVTTGAFYGAVFGANGTIIATEATLFDMLNSLAYSNYAASGARYQAITVSGGDYQLTNPLPQTTNVTSTDNASRNVVLPPANLTTSIPIGVPFYIVNSSANKFTILAYGGGGFPGYYVIYPGTTLALFKTSMSLAAGAYVAYQGAAYAINAGAGGAFNGTQLPVASGQIPVSDSAYATNGGYTASTMTGDCTLAGSSGGNSAITCTIPASHLATQATNTVLGNATSGTAAPTALAVGSCSTAASALNWTTNTGFGCNTSITANIATNTTITDDTSTNATMYPTWVTANSGSLPQKVSSTKLTWNPSAGLLKFSPVTESTPATYQGLLQIAGATQTTVASIGGMEFLVADGYGYKMQAVSASGPALVFAYRSGSATWIEAVRFDSGGQPHFTLANTSTTSSVCYNTGTSLLTYNSTVGTCTVSAARFKDGFEQITDYQAFNMVAAMQPKSWHYLSEPDRSRIGLVADDLLAIDRRLVGFDGDGRVATDDYFAVVTLLVGSVKHLKADNDNLKLRVEQLEKKAATR